MQGSVLSNGFPLLLYLLYLFIHMPKLLQVTLIIFFFDKPCFLGLLSRLLNLLKHLVFYLFHFVNSVHDKLCLVLKFFLFAYHAELPVWRRLLDDMLL